VQQIVTVLGGDIRVSSQLGWGSTFCVTLPCRLADAAVPTATDPPNARCLAS